MTKGQRMCNSLSGTAIYRPFVLFTHPCENLISFPVVQKKALVHIHRTVDDTFQ